MVAEHRTSADAFRDELLRTLESLKVAPEQGPVYMPRRELGYRRVLLRRSQHYVYYVSRPKDLIRVLAVWSCYRGGPPPLPGDRAGVK